MPCHSTHNIIVTQFTGTLDLEGGGGMLHRACGELRIAQLKDNTVLGTQAARRFAPHFALQHTRHNLMRPADFTSTFPPEYRVSLYCNNVILHNIVVLRCVD